MFLIKALKWNPEKVFAMTAKFFLALSFAGIVLHAIIIVKKSI